MKVLFINSVFGKGSTGRIVRQIGDRLEQEGSTYVAAYGRDENPDAPNSYFIGSKWNTYTHALLTRLTDKCGFYSRSATKKLIDHIRQYQPDVIHMHNLHGYYLNIQLLFDYLKTEFTGKVVWTLHDCWAFTGHCAYFTAANCDKWQTGCYDCCQKASYPTSNFLDNSRWNYQKKKEVFSGVPNMTVITVSHWLKKMAEQSFLGQYPVECVYNGIDPTVFHPVENNVKQELGIPNKKLILLVSDGWDTRKGLDRALTVAGLAPKDWHFVIVGLDREQIPTLPENCIGMERTSSQTALVELYSAADVFFNPSIEETFGLVTAEAVACGTPAVVINSTACAEPLGGYGVVLDPYTHEAALSAIRQCLDISKNQSNNQFTIDAMTAGYLACYKK